MTGIYRGILTITDEVVEELPLDKEELITDERPFEALHLKQKDEGCDSKS